MRGGPLVNTNLRTQLFENFKNKKYRDAFVREFIFSRLPLKIRAMREKLSISQAELGERAGVAQARVSKIEDPSYGRLTLSTLLKLASAFDCGLSVDFVPFSRILNEAAALSRESLGVPKFADDQLITPEPSVPSLLNQVNPMTAQATTSHTGYIIRQFQTLTADSAPGQQATTRTGLVHRDRDVVSTDAWPGALKGKGQQFSTHLEVPAPIQQTGGLAHEALGSRPS
jgi:transcriptional regulator with XRE-family HTH domain